MTPLKFDQRKMTLVLSLAKAQVCSLIFCIHHCRDFLWFWHKRICFSFRGPIPKMASCEMEPGLLLCCCSRKLRSNWGLRYCWLLPLLSIPCLYLDFILQLQGIELSLVLRWAGFFLIAWPWSLRYFTEPSAFPCGHVFCRYPMQEFFTLVNLSLKSNFIVTLLLAWWIAFWFIFSLHQVDWTCSDWLWWKPSLLLPVPKSNWRTWFKSWILLWLHISTWTHSCRLYSPSSSAHCCRAITVSACWGMLNEWTQCHPSLFFPMEIYFHVE